MYKSKLNEMRNQLIMRNPCATPILASGKGIRTYIMARLLSDTGRDGKDDLFKKGRGKVGDPELNDWLNQVLSGLGDPGFDNANSGISGKVGSEDVADHMGFVVEHRYIHQFIKPQEEWKMSEPDTVIDYLTAVFKANKIWQGLKQN